MAFADWHEYQILTKRAKRLEELSPQIDWPDNAWMGVSVENEEVSFRIDHLRKTSAKIKFLSCEPLLGPLPNLNLEGIDWVITGGESGPEARPMEEDWVRDIRDQCIEAKVPFFFKQWGGVAKWKNGRELDGRTWDELPASSKFVQQKCRRDRIPAGLRKILREDAQDRLLTPLGD
jgi:protein gp37